MTEEERIVEALVELMNPEIFDSIDTPAAIEQYKMLDISVYTTCEPTIYINLESGVQLVLSYYDTWLSIGTFESSDVDSNCIIRSVAPFHLTEEEFFQRSLVDNYQSLTYEMYVAGYNFCKAKGRVHERC